MGVQGRYRGVHSVYAAGTKGVHTRAPHANSASSVVYSSLDAAGGGRGACAYVCSGGGCVCSGGVCVCSGGGLFGAAKSKDCTWRYLGSKSCAWRYPGTKRVAVADSVDDSLRVLDYLITTSIIMMMIRRGVVCAAMPRT
eukprot:1288682-Rhodomonas_salina.1